MNPLQKVIKRNRVHRGSLPDDTSRRESSPRTKSPVRKGVRPIHVDGRLQAIEVTCACGEVMVIEIEYEGEGTSEEPTS